MPALRRFRLHAAALTIALLQCLLPIAAYAKAAADGGLTQEVCTPLGVKKVVVDGDGVAHEVPPEAGTGHGKHCPLCATPPSLPLSTLIGWHASETLRGAPALSSGCEPAPAAVAKPPATGPPARL
jgi:hypothetical protein